jgi:hypothetical protein
MGDKLEEEGDFWPVFKTPEFVPNFHIRKGVYMTFDLVRFPRAEGALWPVSPPQDVLPCNFGNFSFGQLFLPRCQIHMRLQVNAFPVQVPTAPGVFRGIVLPIVSYSC